MSALSAASLLGGGNQPPFAGSLPGKVAPAQGGGCRVVLVEDLGDYMMILQKALELDGHRVETAVDGVRGLDLIRQSRPDIAFIDIGLPGMDGYSIARVLRAEGLKTFLVALTAYGGDRNRQLAAEAGFDRHILKPLLPEERAEMLRLALGRRTDD